MANVIRCPVCSGTCVEDADGWPCSDCAGRGSIIVNDVAFTDDEQEEDALSFRSRTPLLGLRSQRSQESKAAQARVGDWQT
jgi:hypothetical protein